MRQEWSPQPPGCVKNASRMVPPAPGCVKNASRMVPQPRMCEKCVKNGPPSPRMCEKCVKNGPPSPGCVKNASIMVPPRLVHQCFAIFTQTRVVRKLQQHWSTSVAAIFARAKIATTLVQMREKCNNNGSICAKIVSTPVPHARKVQQHWGQNVRKVCQGLNTIGIYGLGFRV